MAAPGPKLFPCFMPHTLRVRVSLYLVIAFMATLIPFTLLVIREVQEDLRAEIARHVIQMSEVIVKSTRSAMLENKRDIAEKILLDIGRQKGIERIRVIDKDGTIIHSNRLRETGYSVDRKEEPCLHCHKSGKPLEQVPEEDRWTIVEEKGGHRTLNTMAPIHNEQSCATASCHEHKPNQKILGVVDVAYSLDEVDQTVREHTAYIVGTAIAFMLLLGGAASYMLKRQVYGPLKDLEAATNRIAQGDLAQAIPIRSGDEFGHVAEAFNEMQAALRKSAADMEAMIENLEATVVARTRELREAEAEVAQGEKLASVGQLAAGIAHELNNPLTGVLTFTSLLRKKMPDGSADAEDLDLVIRETKRCASIIRRLLDFAREKVPVKGYFDLNQVVDETVRFVDRPAALQQITIETSLDPALPKIWGDADLIKQVVLNIVVNAQQAIEGEGRISVKTRPFAGRLPSKPGIEPIPKVEIVVADTGCGIPEANLQRIFDPFFTSKEVGKGTGLGLSVSYGIIKAHGGAITVESTEGVGTTFHIILPITSPFGETDQRTDASAT